MKYVSKVENNQINSYKALGCGLQWENKKVSTDRWNKGFCHHRDDDDDDDDDDDNIYLIKHPYMLNVYRNLLSLYV